MVCILKHNKQNEDSLAQSLEKEEEIHCKLIAKQDHMHQNHFYPENKRDRMEGLKGVPRGQQKSQKD